MIESPSAHPSPCWLTDVEVRQVASDVCTLLLRFEVEPPDDAPADATAEFHTGVRVEGGWRGLIVLEADLAFAESAAGTIFGRSANSPTGDDVRDALCELLNMIGGNLKPLLPGPSCLQLPAVIGSEELDCATQSLREIHRSAFRCGAGWFGIRLLAADAQTPTAR